MLSWVEHENSFITLGPDQILHVYSQELEVRSLNHSYSLKTKSSQCHYVMTLWAFGFEAIGVIQGSNFKLLWHIAGWTYIFLIPL